MRWTTQLQILLHVYRVAGLSSGFHLRLRSHPPRSPADGNARLPRRHPNVAVQRGRVGDLLPVRVVSHRSRRLSHLPDVERPDDERGHQGLVLVEGRTGVNESLLAREYLLELLLYPLRATPTIAD